MVFSKNFAEHLQQLDEVLQRIEDAWLKLKPSKCVFGVTKVEFLRRTVSHKELVQTRAKWKPLSAFQSRTP